VKFQQKEEKKRERNVTSSFAQFRTTLKSSKCETH